MKVKAVCSSPQAGAVTSLRRAPIGGWLRAKAQKLTGVNEATRLFALC